MQRSIENELEQEPESYNSWKEVYELRNAQLKLNPWTFDILFIIKDARMVKQDDQWIIYDNEKFYTPVVPDFDLEKVMKWLVISGNRPQNAACVLRNGKVLPLGIFQNNQYTTL